MNVVESVERGLNWLSTPKTLPGRLEMETQRGRRLELEIVSFTIRVPVAGGMVFKLPVFLTVLPVGTSPVQGPDPATASDDSEPVSRPS